MSDINWELFGSDVDLCVIENEYIEEALEYEEILAEAGAVIDKSRLKDEKYIKELIKDIKDGKAKYNWGTMFITVVGGFLNGATAATFLPFPAAIPAMILCNTLLSGFLAGFTRGAIEEKSTNKVLANIDKMAKKVEKMISKTKDEEEKKALEKQLTKLKNNKKLILEKLK